MTTGAAVGSGHMGLFAVPVEWVTANAGLPRDQATLILCCLLALPLGTVHKRMPGATAKHVFSLLTGLGFLWVLLAEGVVHSIATTLITYVLVRVLPRKWSPTVISVFALLYLSASHIYRVYTDYMGWSMDFTGAQMILTTKMTMFAFNLADGMSIKAGEKLHKSDRIVAKRTAVAIDHMPSLLEYLSYMFYYGTILTGPGFEYKYYKDFTEGVHFKKYGLDKAPSTWKHSAVLLLKVVLCYIGIFVSGYFPVQGFAHTEAFTGQSFLWKWGYLTLAVAVFRYKYYLAWYLAEAGCTAAGFGLTGVDSNKKPVWGGMSNADPLNVELATNMKMMINSWNKKTNDWLTNYVYLRVPYGRTVATLAVRMVSAFWHGFYPGYYLFFFSAVLLNEVAMQFDRVFRPMVYAQDGVTKKWTILKRSKLVQFVYHTLGFCFCATGMQYFGTAFCILDYHQSITAWSSVKWYGHIGAVVIIVLLKIVVPSKRKSAKKVQ